MLRLTVSTEEYLQIGEDVKIVFLGGSKNHLRIMVDAPKDLNVVRSKVIENNAKSEEERASLPHYYAVPDLPEKYRKKRIVVNDAVKSEKFTKRINKQEIVRKH
ncbi:MAG: carbon storage regulator [Lachnospiraceae bacterium]|nr:carbon storage regulator [Lachnospiraceae bacterium]